jgi:hypothetical protein
VEVAAHDAVDLGRLALCNPPDCREEIENGTIRQSVEDEFSLTAPDDEPGAPQVLQMLGGIGDRHANAVRQQLNAAFALGELLEQPQAVRMREGLRYDCKLGKQDLLWVIA